MLDSDDLIDFQIMEAVALKVSEEDRAAEQQQKHKDWKKDKQGLDNLKNIAGG